MESPSSVVGIDVGGKKKGFHAVALCDGVFEKKTSTDHREIVDWCREREATVVVVDAPCGWSQTGSSRLAERELSAKKIHCFATPTRDRALAHKKGFYDWVFNGEKLYSLLRDYYPIFVGKSSAQMCYESFPHVIVCALEGKVIAAKPKNKTRRDALLALGYNESKLCQLSNIDFIDAALCAVTAKELAGSRRILKFGNRGEGFIVVPAINPICSAPAILSR